MLSSLKVNVSGDPPVPVVNVSIRTSGRAVYTCLIQKLRPIYPIYKPHISFPMPIN